MEPGVAGCVERLRHGERLDRGAQSEDSKHKTTSMDILPLRLLSPTLPVRETWVIGLREFTDASPCTRGAH